jgi:hypothetical protein
MLFILLLWIFLARRRSVVYWFDNEEGWDRY